jgi:mono/diheme cytochrome c family protein
MIARPRRGWLAILFVLLALVAGCADWLPMLGEGEPVGRITDNIPAEYRGQVSSVPLDDPTVIAGGRRLYEANCAACHGIAGNGDGTRAPYLDFRPPAFSAPTLKRALAENPDYVYWWISEGVTETPMPAFKDQLDPNDRWAIIAYLRQLSTQPGPPSQSGSRRPPFVPTKGAGQP